MRHHLNEGLGDLFWGLAPRPIAAVGALDEADAEVGDVGAHDRVAVT